VPFGVQLSENVLVIGTSTNKSLHNINCISKIIHFLQPLHLNRQQIVNDTCYACSSSHYVTTILIHFHNCCPSDMQTSQDPNFIFDTQLEEVQLQKHELQKHFHKHMELPCVYENVFVTHENDTLST